MVSRCFRAQLKYVMCYFYLSYYCEYLGDFIGLLKTAGICVLQSASLVCHSFLG